MVHVREKVCVSVLLGGYHVYNNKEAPQTEHSCAINFNISHNEEKQHVSICVSASRATRVNVS